jgi:two-component system, response regulator, stage 0 sporulation protein A
MKSKEKSIDVLVAQYNKKHACIIKDYLDKMDEFEIADFAFDGMTTCDYAKELKPDLILVDLIMPKMDGLGVVEAVKNIDELKNTKIIITSSISLDFAIDRLRTLPIDYFFIKPILFETFSNRLKDLFVKNNNLTKARSFGEKNLIEIKIKSYLKKIGVPPNIKGYNYLTKAILMAQNGKSVYGNLTNGLYPDVANIYDTTLSRVERSIRHAIEVAWNRGNIKILDELFGYTISEQKGKPTNGEFIAMIADKVKTDGMLVD